MWLLSSSVLPRSWYAYATHYLRPYSITHGQWTVFLNDLSNSLMALLLFINISSWTHTIADTTDNLLLFFFDTEASWNYHWLNPTESAASAKSRDIKWEPKTYGFRFVLLLLFWDIFLILTSQAATSCLPTLKRTVPSECENHSSEAATVRNRCLSNSLCTLWNSKLLAYFRHWFNHWWSRFSLVYILSLCSYHLDDTLGCSTKVY
jgi:hypothetical protein